MKVIAYMRVSMKTGMTVENQRPEIEKWVMENRKNIENITWMEEKESTRRERPVKEAAVELLKEGTFDTIVCVRMDRFARSVAETLGAIESLLPRGTRFVFIRNGFDFHKDSMNASQKLQLTMFSAFAEFEREVMRERIIAGQHRAWNIDGKQKGRPRGSKDKHRRDSFGYRKRWEREKVKARAEKDNEKFKAIKQI